MKMIPINLGLALILVVGGSLAWDDNYYTAAVYEHSRQGENITDDPAAVIKSNLEYYKRAAKLAKDQGSDIIVFPEYGLFPPLDRKNLKNYLEFIPNPEEIHITPCDEAKLFRDRQIMYSLSCIAKNNKIVVVANMGGIEKCKGDPTCPPDGDFHFNANVAFNENGTLVGRYYKEHLYFESGMDLPRSKQNPVFRTGFGKFAMFICFDSIFERMAKMSRFEDIDAIMFTTMWMNSSPFYTATQWWQAWAIGNNATILAANMQTPGYGGVGSGIFRGKEISVAHTLNPDGISKLIVAPISRRRHEGIPKASITAILKNGVKKWNIDDDGKDVPKLCAFEVLGEAKDILKDYRCINENVAKYNYTLMKLEKAEDHLELCSYGMCCVLDYATNGMNESYYLGVFNGTHNIHNRYFWWEENCFLARCDDLNGTDCGIFPMIVEQTLFYEISMKANFTTQYIYPSLVSNKMRLVSVDKWDFHKGSDWASVKMKNKSGISLIAATLKGRVYEKDPPYIR